MLKARYIVYSPIIESDNYYDLTIQYSKEEAIKEAEKNNYNCYAILDAFSLEYLGCCTIQDLLAE